MSPKEVLLDPREAFDRCVERLRLVDFEGFSAAQARFGDTSVYMSRQHSHGDGSNPKRITNLRTSLDVSLPIDGSVSINISVMNPAFEGTLVKINGYSWAVDILTREWNRETEIRYVASGEIQSMKGEVTFPNADEEQEGAQTMIIDNRWELEVPSYGAMLENIGSDGLGVVLRGIHRFEPVMGARILEFAETPSWAPIWYVDKIEGVEV